MSWNYRKWSPTRQVINCFSWRESCLRCLRQGLDLLYGFCWFVGRQVARYYINMSATSWLWTFHDLTCKTCLCFWVFMIQFLPTWGDMKWDISAPNEGARSHRLYDCDYSVSSTERLWLGSVYHTSSARLQERGASWPPPIISNS